MSDTTNSSIDNSALIAEIERLRAENTAAKAALAAQSQRGLTLKVSVKGAVSIYGLGRFPVTLYKGQVERLFSEENVAKVRAFVTAHPELAVKGE